MNLEPIIQSEVSQKEKYKYHTLMHMYKIQKDGTDELIFRAAMEKPLSFEVICQAAVMTNTKAECKRCEERH